MIFHIGKVISGIFIVLCAFPLSAQMFYFRDSLEVLELEKKIIGTTDKRKIDIQNQIAATIVHFNPEKAFKISNSALTESDKINYQSGKAFATSNIGFYYFLKNDYRNAYTHQIQALYAIDETVAIEIEMLIHERIDYIYYFSQANVSKIVNHFDIVMNYYDSLGMKNRAGSILLIQGGGSYRAGKYVEAYNYFNHFLAYSKDLDIPAIEKLIVYYSLGDIFFIRNDLKNCWSNYKRCLGLTDVGFIEENALMSNIFMKIGNYYNHIHNMDSAFYYYNEALGLSETIFYTRGLMKSNMGLGYLYKSSGNFQKSISCFNSAYHYGLMIDSSGSFFFHPRYKYLIDVTDETWMSSPKEFKKYLGKLGVAEALTNLIQLELDNTQKYTLNSRIQLLLGLKDSIINYKIRKEVIDLGLKYETENKEQQIRLLQKENELQKSKIRQKILIYYGVAGFVIVILFIVIFYIWQNRLESEQDKTGLQQRLFRSQMNPHFIYNSLSCIQSFILSHNPDMASRYLAHFAKLMRNILGSSTKEFVTLEDEIETIENYLELQKVRFSDKFDFKITVDNALDTTTLLIPPMIAQPFIENAIEHGIRHKETKGLIEIRFSQNSSSFTYEISDDGIGREKAKEILSKSDKAHKSMATSITRERLDVFNKKRKHKIILSMIDLKNVKGEGIGTRVIFEVPLKL